MKTAGPLRTKLSNPGRIYAFGLQEKANWERILTRN
jgi:hypothetical protein